ncbi:MAG: Proteasome subunit beta [Promethearchaeota archaeon]|nr:MAG: Proteasome subunit beta [Candidatus Lokiarchaeota archaeon]
MNKEDLLRRSNSKFSFNSLHDRIRSKKSKEIQTKNNTYKTGTTTVALACKDAVVMGTDKRASMAYFVSSKHAKKLHKIQDHLWMTIAGSVADAQYIIDIIKAYTSLYQYEKEKKVLIKSAAKILANILYRNKLFPYQVGLILGGVTEDEGPVVIDIGALGSLLPEKFVAVGSGQNFSYGVLESRYRDDLTIEEGKDIVKRAVKSSIIRDMASGNGIDIAVIKSSGPAYREFIKI